MWWMLWTTVTALYVIRQWPYFFGISGLVKIILPQWLLEGGPVNHQDWALSSSIWATQENHTQIYTMQQCHGLYLGKCLLKEDMRKTATDQTRWCLHWAPIQTQSQLHMAALYNNRSLWTPLSHSVTSANREGWRFGPSSCEDGISEISDFRALEAPRLLETGSVRKSRNHLMIVIQFCRHRHPTSTWTEEFYCTIN